MENIIIDTNLIIDDENILYKLLKKYEKIIIPLTVLKELDKLKFIPDTSYSARKAINLIKKFKAEYADKIDFYVNDTLMSDNDAKIIGAAEELQAALATKDISMSILAEAKNIKTETYEVVLNNIFKPYIEIDVETANLAEFDYKQEYFEDYEEILAKISKISSNFNKNGWFFVFFCEKNAKKEYIYANNPLKMLFERIDNNPEYRKLGKENTIKAKDAYQVCAFYALKNAQNVVITGRWGSGKSLIGTSYCVDNRSKTFLTRAPIGISRKYDIGYLPGGTSEKMIDWVSGITSALYYLYANTRGQKDGKGSNYDHVRDSVFKDKFEIIPINSVQGLSLLKNDILLVDEIQLLDIDTMSMILSRPSEDGKLILLGDLNQTYSIVKPSESGLLKLLRVLPHKAIAYVELRNSYRSSILEVADLLQDKTIY